MQDEINHYTCHHSHPHAGQQTHQAWKVGGTHYTWLLLLLISHVTFGNPDDPYHKCYRPLYNGKTQGSNFSLYTFISHHCYNSSQVDTSIKNDQMHKVTKTVGQNRGAHEETNDCLHKSNPRMEKGTRFDTRFNTGMNNDKQTKTDVATHRFEANSTWRFTCKTETTGK